MPILAHKPLTIAANKPMKKIIVLIILFSASGFAQATIENFLNEPFTNTAASIREKHPDKRIEEQDVMIYTVLTYYDWIEPISIKVGYMFGKDGSQKGKVIANAKNSEEDAQKFYDMAKAALIKKYGTNHTEKSLMGMDGLSWNNIEGWSVMLARKKGKATITLFRR